jgi:hypothetical protein
MKRSILLLVWLAAYASGAALASSSVVPTNNPTGLQIVTLRPGVDVDGFVAEFGLKPSRIYRRALKGFAAAVGSDTLTQMKQDSRIIAVEPDGKAVLCDQTVLTGVARMNITHFPMAHIDGGDHRIDVDVAVLDSGIQTNHPDLNVVQAIGFTASGTNGDDTLGHGTHVAGIIGALDNDFGVVGVAPGARLWSVRILDGSSGDWSTALSGMDYIAANADKIEVVNASFTSDGVSAPFEAIHEAVSNIVSQGVVFVAAAGNFSQDLAGDDATFGTEDDYLPAALAEVMAVSAMDPTSDTIASFSNYSRDPRPANFVISPGLCIDVAAPGVNILSTFTNSGYATMSGTSMASPHTAGLVALYIAANGRAHSAQDVYAIRQTIVNNSLPQTQWMPNGMPFDAINNPTGDPDGNPEPLAFPSENWVPLPAITGATHTPGGFQLSLPAVPGYDYTVQYSGPLSASNQWSNLGTISGEGSLSVLSLTGTNPDPALRFYRAARTPSP